MDVDCRRLVELLHDFVAGELPPEEHSTLQEHLEKCAPCGVYVSTYRITITMSRNLPQKCVPQDAAMRLLAALEHECSQAKQV